MVEVGGDAALNAGCEFLSIRRAATALVTLGRAIMGIVCHRLIGSRNNDAGSLAVDVTWLTFPQAYLLRGLRHSRSGCRRCSRALGNGLNSDSQEAGEENSVGDLHFACAV